MPLYDYRCTVCGNRDTKSYTFAEYPSAPPHECGNCGHAPMTRTYNRFAVIPSMPDHYNPTVGSYVTGKRQFNDELKRKSEEATARTGIPHNYEPIDLRDKDAVGATDEGLDTTYDANVRDGNITPGGKAWQ